MLLSLLLLLLWAFTNNSTCTMLFNPTAIRRPMLDHWSCSHHSLLLAALWMANTSRWKSLWARSVLFACNDNDDWCFYVIAIWFNRINIAPYLWLQKRWANIWKHPASFGRKTRIHHRHRHGVCVVQSEDRLHGTKMKKSKSLCNQSTIDWSMVLLSPISMDMTDSHCQCLILFYDDVYKLTDYYYCA